VQNNKLRHGEKPVGEEPFTSFLILLVIKCYQIFPSTKNFSLGRKN
jgi:hypothetical protein